MHYEHQGMRLWIKPDKRFAGGTIEQGSDVNLTVGVEPADASNRVQVKYRVNGGPVTTIAAEPVHHVGNAQYFKAQLPCSTLCDGDTLEYSAVCQCAGRQVPAAHEAEQFTSSLRVMTTGATDTQAPVFSYAKSIESGPIKSLSSVGTRTQTVVRDTNKLKPTHLSLFVSTQHTGHPVARIPFYAEVSVVSVLPRPECNLQEAIRSGINNFIMLTSVKRVSSFKPVIRELSEKLVELLCDALYRLLAPEILNQWIQDQDNTVNVIVRIIQTTSELAKDRSTDWNNPQLLDQLLEEAILAYATENNLPLAEKNAQSSRIAWTHPMGVLSTDHAGYLSFDLTRLPPDVADAVALALEARRRNPDTPTDTSIWLYPMAQEEKRIDALTQMRFAHDAIVVRLELDIEFDPVLCQPKLCESLKNVGFTAMQSPSLTDWRLSPASFATNPSALLGADGCESLLPANIALQEFYFYQIVSLSGSDIQPSDLPSETQGKIKFGIAHEYRLAWYPLGHSLGQIQYSLPLAPGESINLAVIDWTRRDVGSRTEDTKESEQLVHNQRRDRTITETVNAAIKEYQEGSSFMAGLAHSAGAAGSYGPIGAAVGTAWSLGGSSSDSSGSRDIAASTVQKLSDNISQSSASMRELQSTVVVQTTQNEKETIETRTVVNYNHSHTLTILYYEVLRHFRVVTEYVKSRPIVLVKLDTNFLSEENLVGVPKQPLDGSTNPTVHIEYTTNFVLHVLTTQNLIENRSALEAALLDKRHIEGFNALQRVDHRRNVAAITIPISPPTPTVPSFRFFNFDMKTGGIYDQDKDKQISIEATLWPVGHQLYNNGITLNPVGSLAFEHANNSFTARLPDDVPPVSWNDIDMIMININIGKPKGDLNISFEHIQITGIDTNGDKTSLVDKNYAAEGGHLVLSRSDSIRLPTSRPHVPPPPQPRPAEEIEDDAKINELIGHLRYHRAHYSRALYLHQNTAERARQLNAVKLSGDATLLEKVENRPLEMIGDFVAYPANSNWARIIQNKIDNLPPLDDLRLNERLVTLPTRGLFAEAKLGHCNASEEIDNTRFWDWQQSPIPHMAPDIAAIQAGQHLLKDMNLQSTPFPQPMVNIVNPPTAPDPTGLAAAMNVLGTPNIFRDMSGRTEVADLLKKLSDNSISIAEAANRAREIQAKYGGGDGSSAGGGGGSSSGAMPSSVGGPRARPTEPSRATRDTQDFRNELKSGVRDGMIPAEDANSTYQKLVHKRLLDEFGISPEQQSIFDNPNAIASNDAGFVPTDGGGAASAPPQTPPVSTFPCDKCQLDEPPYRAQSTLLCWAAVTTMLVSWHDSQDYTLEAVVKMADKVKLAGEPDFYDYFIKNQAIPFVEFPKFLKKLGIIFESGSASFTPKGICDLLRKHGPIGVTLRTGGPLMSHGIVVYGIDNDLPDTNQCWVVYHDPEPSEGAASIMTFEKFYADYSAEAEKGVSIFFYP